MLRNRGWTAAVMTTRSRRTAMIPNSLTRNTGSTSRLVDASTTGGVAFGVGSSATVTGPAPGAGQAGASAQF